VDEDQDQGERVEPAPVVIDWERYEADMVDGQVRIMEGDREVGRADPYPPGERAACVIDRVKAQMGVMKEIVERDLRAQAEAKAAEGTVKE